VPTVVLRICRGCPVRLACATYAVTATEEHGVWAGLTPQDLLDLREQLAAGADLDQLLEDALGGTALDQPTGPIPYRATVCSTRPIDAELPYVA
jgi:hypothetical protein